MYPNSLRTFILNRFNRDSERSDRACSWLQRTIDITFSLEYLTCPSQTQYSKHSLHLCPRAFRGWELNANTACCQDVPTLSAQPPISSSFVSSVASKIGADTTSHCILSYAWLFTFPVPVGCLYPWADVRIFLLCSTSAICDGSEPLLCSKSPLATGWRRIISRLVTSQ